MAWKPLPFKMLNDRFDLIEKRLARLAKEANKKRYEKYQGDPFAYAREVLKVEWWHRQQEVVEALLRPPYRVLVKASHSVGKSFLAGGLVNWFYDTHDPGVVITTAPTHRQVKDVLWKEVRRQRGNRPGFPGPKITRLEDSPTHFAVGFTAGTGTSFQGQHEAAVLIVLDEAVGIDRQIWEAADSMVMGVKYGIVAFCNPTDPTSEFYAREQSGLWTTIHIPCLEHPNILAELEGRDPPYPSAVRLAWLEERLKEYCRPVTESVEANDFEWPPGSGKWLRPGPLAEARLLGRWPSSSVGVWSDMLWQKCEACEPATDGFLPEIGVDIARFGCFDDQTEILTDRGWLLFNDLTGAEQVLTLNGDTAEWGPITQIHRYPFDGEMNLLESERVNFCITDNHRLVTRRGSKTQWAIERYDQLPQYFVSRKTNGWSGTPIGRVEFTSKKQMPHGGFSTRTWNFDPIDWCRFVGWFVSEGCIYHEKRKHGRKRIQIAQKASPDKIQEIRDLLARMGIKYRFNHGTFSFSNRAIAEHLLDHCGRGAASKRVPDYIKNATSAEIDAFLDAFCSGDGTRRKGKRLSYYTSSYRLADDIQEILVKIGRAGKLKCRQPVGSTFTIDGRTITRDNPSYVLNERQRASDLWVNKASVLRVPYKGFVHCVSTPHQTIMVRRGGITMWSGNSDNSEFHVRCGNASLHHEGHNGLDNAHVIGLLRRQCKRWAEWANERLPSGAAPIRPEQILCKIDDDGMGGRVTDHAEGYNWVPVRAGSSANDPEQYPNKRSEMWFDTATRAEQASISLALLPDDIRRELKRQAMAPVYKLDAPGRRVVEPKEVTKKKLGRSPDGMDAVNLAYYEHSSGEVAAWVDTGNTRERTTWRDRRTR